MAEFKAPGRHHNSYQRPEGLTGVHAGFAGRPREINRIPAARVSIEASMFRAARIR
jgi:hypothetical protein